MRPRRAAATVGAEGCSHRRAIIRALQQAGSGAPQSQAGKRIRKGLGEIGVVGSAAAALADAVRHATGKRIRDMPVTMDKVLA